MVFYRYTRHARKNVMLFQYRYENKTHFFCYIRITVKQANIFFSVQYFIHKHIIKTRITSNPNYKQK